MLKLTSRTITALVLTLYLGLVVALQFNFYMDNHAQQNSADDYLMQKLFNWSEALKWVERLDYDLHLRWHNPGYRTDDVVIVEVNEISILDRGQFPFSRSVYRQFIDALSAAGAKVVAFDITFSEKERNGLADLNELREEVIKRDGFDSPVVRLIDERVLKADSDENLANALGAAKIPVVLGWSFADDDSSGKLDMLKADEETLKSLRQFQLKPRVQGVTRLDKSGRELPLVSTIRSMHGRRPVANIPFLMNALSGRSSIGHFMPSADSDSVIRRVPLLLEYDNVVQGSLALNAAAAYFEEEATYFSEDGKLSVRGVKRGANGQAQDGQLSVPLTARGELLAKFYGPERIFPYVEFSDVIGTDPADTSKVQKPPMSIEDLKKNFAGKIVFVGVTAIGLKDIRATPYSKDYPGVEVHATIASNVLQKKYMELDTRYFWTGALLILGFGLVCAWSVYSFHPVFSFLCATVSIGIIQFGAHSFFFDQGVVVPTILPSFACFTIFFTGMLYRYFTEEREKKMVRTAFGRYVSSAVVEEILKDQSKLRLGGQKRELTVMFVDLVGFTKISEHMDAGVVTTLLNEYFTRMTNILLRNKGTLDKYMGDGIMCFWGAPLELADHAELACRTALEMQAEIARINLEWKGKHGIVIENRIGVHTGEMAVGNMGSDQVFSYTVMGDNVNLGSRLEGVNTVYGTRTIVSAATAAKAGSSFLYRPLDKVQVKGKEDAVEILELVGLKEEREPEWVHAFRTGLKHYQAGEWNDAESAFGACLTLKPGDGPSQIFVERIRDFRLVEPDDWQGVWKLSSK